MCVSAFLILMEYNSTTRTHLQYLVKHIHHPKKFQNLSRHGRVFLQIAMVRKLTIVYAFTQGSVHFENSWLFCVRTSLLLSHWEQTLIVMMLQWIHTYNHNACETSTNSCHKFLWDNLEWWNLPDSMQIDIIPLSRYVLPESVNVPSRTDSMMWKISLINFTWYDQN